MSMYIEKKWPPPFPLPVDLRHFSSHRAPLAGSTARQGFIPAMTSDEIDSMTPTRKTSEALRAALILLGAFVLTLVTEYCLLITWRKAAQQHWSGSDWMWWYAVWCWPFVAMLVPGVRYLFARKWVLAVVLLVVGGLLAWQALVLALTAAWVTR